MLFIIQLFAALATGCVQSLVNLDVSRNFHGIKRPTRDNSSTWTDFFSSAKALKTVDFSSNRLPQETLRCVILCQ